ncbi:MAG TPA: SPFH domain-containing protein [Rhizomicrobium sp.]|jgi:regulator of protease activity HflC (stomatin/prohibitin superfamily)
MSDVAAELREVGPLGQSVAYAFRFLFVAACIIAAGWFLSNIHQIPPDSQAVVVRLGTIARIQGPGLLIALPKPIETVVVLPARDRQIPLSISRFMEGQPGGVSEGFDLNSDPRLNAGFLLTGDPAVVHLQAQLYYQITDPADYMIAQQHVASALQRLFIASAISTLAGRDLDSILVARPEIASRAGEASRRERLRGDLVRAVNRRLSDLAAAGSSLGIAVSRVDLVPAIPAEAKSAFDNVLVVSQRAQTQTANARTYAQTMLQETDREKDRTFTDATAAADERISNAKVQTASIAALAKQTEGMSREMQMSRLYYDRIGPLLKKAGRVQAVDRTGAAHVLLPGSVR